MGIDRVMFRFASPPRLATWEIWWRHGKRTWKCSPNRNEESLHPNRECRDPGVLTKTDVGLSVMKWPIITLGSPRGIQQAQATSRQSVTIPLHLGPWRGLCSSELSVWNSSARLQCARLQQNTACSDSRSLTQTGSRYILPGTSIPNYS
jgi:hypothetical protein